MYNVECKMYNEDQPNSLEKENWKSLIEEATQNNYQKKVWGIFIKLWIIIFAIYFMQSSSKLSLSADSSYYSDFIGHSFELVFWSVLMAALISTVPIISSSFKNRFFLISGIVACISIILSFVYTVNYLEFPPSVFLTLIKII